jgi:hypothetical protein
MIVDVIKDKPMRITSWQQVSQDVEADDSILNIQKRACRGF